MRHVPWALQYECICGWCYAPDPADGAYSAPQTLSSSQLIMALCQVTHCIIIISIIIVG